MTAGRVRRWLAIAALALGVAAAFTESSPSISNNAPAAPAPRAFRPPGGC